MGHCFDLYLFANIEHFHVFIGHLYIFIQLSLYIFLLFSLGIYVNDLWKVFI
jgi:hypothetical protein